jgi:hypothetical protein
VGIEEYENEMVQKRYLINQLIESDIIVVLGYKRNYHFLAWQVFFCSTVAFSPVPAGRQKNKFCSNPNILTLWSD